MSTIYRTTDIRPHYPTEVSPVDDYPPPPAPPNNSKRKLKHPVMSPSPITVPPGMSPSPITVPPGMSPSVKNLKKQKKKKVQFRQNLYYNTEVDIFWYNNSPITESQYNWLDRRLENKLEIPETLTYQTNILYKEEDDTCWFKGYNISCEIYNVLIDDQTKNTKNLAKSLKKPGLYYDPLEKISLLSLNEIGHGEEAENKNQKIERDWRLLKYGPETAYRDFTIEPGRPADVSGDQKVINEIQYKKKTNEFYEDQHQLLLRNYNKDKYKTGDNNVYERLLDAIAIVKSDNSTDKEKENAFTYLKEKYMGIDDDFIIGGKKRKQTRKRKKSKRKTNTRGKSQKK